jgi:hypothetical protein
MTAMLAEKVLGIGHPHDRLVLAAVRALRDELESMQAIDAAEAARELCGPQPGLAALRAIRPWQERLATLHLSPVPFACVR